MTDLEKSMDSMITVFNKYAHDGKHGKALTKKELRKLIEAELPNFLKVRIFLAIIPDLYPQCESLSIFKLKMLLLMRFAPWTHLLLHLFQTQKNANSVDHIMKDLDQNKDDVLDFEEFMPFIAGLTMACEKYCSMSAKKKWKNWCANTL